MKRRTLHEILRVSEAAHNNDIKGAAKVKKRNCHTRKVRHSSLFLASAIQIQFAFLYAANDDFCLLGGERRPRKARKMRGALKSWQRSSVSHCGRDLGDLPSLFNSGSDKKSSTQLSPHLCIFVCVGA